MSIDPTSARFFTTGDHTPFAQHPRPETLLALADAKPLPFWLDDPDRPAAAAALTTHISADLTIIGAGFTGLWTALLAKEDDPSREVVLIEANEAAIGATGRNGGFVSASLTHGFENGLKRWPNELAKLIQLGHENLSAIESTITRLAIDCDFERTGELLVATEPYQVDHLRARPDQVARFGEQLEWIDQAALKARIDSPTYLGALLDRSGTALVNPARLAWGLREACLKFGVKIFDRTPAIGLAEETDRVTVKTPYGSIRSKRVALATNAYPPLLNRLSYYVVPVYDYVLMTEPLSDQQRASIGWPGRQGIGDSGNQFHYTRLSRGGRILWGGYDAIYHWNNGFGSHLENDPQVFGRLAEHFFQTFPQLEGVRFTHAWGGAIDTCSRFSAFWGTTHHGRTAYALGYTGLGVGASRFGAQVMLDFLNGRATARTALDMVRTQPTPFPPEPLRSIGINLTRRALDQADRNEGRRNLWLRVLDQLGLGFDS